MSFIARTFSIGYGSIYFHINLIAWKYKPYKEKSLDVWYPVWCYLIFGYESLIIYQLQYISSV